MRNKLTPVYYTKPNPGGLRWFKLKTATPTTSLNRWYQGFEVVQWNAWQDLSDIVQIINDNGNIAKVAKARILEKRVSLPTN